MKKTALDANSAAAVSLKALAFLAGEQERFDRFMALTGLDPATIRMHASEGEFQSAVLEYLLADEAMLLQFCEAEALAPTLPAEALRLLAGRHAVNI
jgi:hypothetical protein